jgi:enoyl-CoA hydratase/carnithine racemase
VLGEVIISDPPLNLFGMELLDELATATEQAAGRDARAILLRADGPLMEKGPCHATFEGR